MQDVLKILIVEDDAIIAQLIEHYLISFGHQILDIVHNSERALDLIHNLRPDLVLLDINIEGFKDGIEIARVIEENYQIPYIFLTALSDHATLERARQVRPSAYIVKPFKEADLYTAISIGLSNFVHRDMKSNICLERINEEALSPLSSKEYSVLLNIANGLTNEQIAVQLDLSKNTVKWHTQNIYSKLGVSNRTAAAQLLNSL